MNIRDLVSVRSQPTVVRLDHLEADDASWITQSYYITDEVGGHLQGLRHLMDQRRGKGIFLIGHYGSGKSHFMAYLIQQVQNGEFVDPVPEVVWVSLLDYAADVRLEDILRRHLPAETETGDRRQWWTQIASRTPHGMLVVLDELSEFLRSKPDHRAFSEDVRFLQFLGEWAMDHQVWVIASLQEQIEHTGELEHDLYRKIKDRYPLRLLLSPAHVKDLIAQWVLEKKPGYEAAVEKLARRLKSAFPTLTIDYPTFGETYPIHPATLELLEEVRDRFSQARGVVDFVMAQLKGDPGRGTPAMLDAPWGSLICPDRIADHFADLFDIQAEFLPLAQNVLPFFRKRMSTLFDNQARQDLAWRLVKLLILVHLAPARSHLSVEEAAAWLLHQVTTIDPDRNLAIVERTLDALHREGAFIAKTAQGYALDLKDDSRDTLDRLLAREMAILKNHSDVVLEELVPLLDGHPFNPFELERDAWQRKSTTWHFHPREFWICLGNSAPGPLPKEATREAELQLGMPWGKPMERGDYCALQPGRIALNSELQELVGLCRIRQRPLDPSVAQRVDDGIKTRADLFRKMVVAAYTGGRLVRPNGEEHRFHPMSEAREFAGFLQQIAQVLLRHRFPRFEAFAPTHGPLPKEAYRQLMTFLESADLEAPDAPDFVKLIREAFLVPMGLMRRSGRTYQVTAKLEKHELVTLIQPLLEHAPIPSRVYQHLRAPVYGLVPDQIHLLLITLLTQGEIDIVKSGKSYRDLYVTMVYPIQYDRITKGRALSVAQLRDLEILCKRFEISLPKTWSVVAQRRCVRNVKELAQQVTTRLGEFSVRLGQAFQDSALKQRVDAHLNRWAALHKGERDLQGIQHLLFEIASPERFFEENQTLMMMSDRFEARKRVMDRLMHLLSHDLLRQKPLNDPLTRLAQIPSPPRLDDWEAGGAWIDDAQAVYQAYKRAYTEAHDRWWNDVEAHPAWRDQPPRLCHSIHLNLKSLVAQWKQSMAQAQQKKCAGLVNLDFSPVCHCQFDGASSPVIQELARAEATMAEIEQVLKLFFQQDQVKAKVQKWVDDGFEANPETHAYLTGQRDYPIIENVDALDQLLAGVELVQTVDAAPVMDLLTSRVWGKETLLDALDRAFSELGPRFKFAAPMGSEPTTMLAWCVAQCLKTGEPLPEGLSAEQRRRIPEWIQPQFIQPLVLNKLEDLNLGEEGVQKVLQLVAQGAISVRGEPPIDTAIGALLCLTQPPDPKTPEDLARVSAALYGQRDRLLAVDETAGLKLFDHLARASLDPLPQKLTDALKDFMGYQWLVIDCLGMPLVDSFQTHLSDWLPEWECRRRYFCRVSRRSDTRHFFDDLINADLIRALIKIDVVDGLIHRQTWALDDLIRVAQAELTVALKKVHRNLDQTEPIAVFADHGFRLDKNGTRFTHGGQSTLERIVPLWILDPATDEKPESDHRGAPENG